MTKGVCARPPGVGDVAGEVVVLDEETTRIAELELGPRQALHWHYRTNFDRVATQVRCLPPNRASAIWPKLGPCRASRMPLVRHELRPGQHCHVAPRRAHRVLNPDDAPARYLIIQGGAPYDYFPIDALDAAERR